MNHQTYLMLTEGRNKITHFLIFSISTECLKYTSLMLFLLPTDMNMFMPLREEKKSDTLFLFRNFSNSTSITRIEDLSNDLFYEIFDIYEIFSDLNNRFRCLLTFSSVPMKIKLSFNSDTILEHRCKNIIIPNIHRIISLHLSDSTLIEKFFRQCMINSSFSCLKSILLNGISEHKLLKLLFYLNSLPQLSSLTIRLNEYFNEDFGDVYHMIFHLSALQYLELSFPSKLEFDLIVPVVSNEQFSTLKYLIIDYSSTINELISILYCTPQLYHLTCKRL